jgi:hypothetical protein
MPILCAHHRRHLAERHEHVDVVVGSGRHLTRLHDRLEAVQHPLTGRRLARHREGKWCEHEREADDEDRPEQLAVHLYLLVSVNRLREPARGDPAAC